MCFLGGGGACMLPGGIHASQGACVLPGVCAYFLGCVCTSWGCACFPGVCMLPRGHSCFPGACMPGGGGMRNWGACMLLGDMHVCQGAYMLHGGHACQVVERMYNRGGMCAMHAASPDATRYSRSMSGRYASYWNAFFFVGRFKVKILQ